jgi:hypothetical protein
VWIGDKYQNNHWQRSNAALDALNIPADPMDNHHHHYHVDINAPALRPIEPQNNLTVAYADSDGSSITTPSAIDASSSIQDMALDLVKEWGLSENDMNMYFPVDLESTQPPMVMVAAADNKVSEKVVGVVGACAIADNSGSFSFGSMAQGYLVWRGKTLQEVDVSKVKIKIVSIVRQPEHGRLFIDDTDQYGSGFYYPDKGFIGKDRVEAIVSVGSDLVRVVYYFAVQSKAVDNLTRSEEKKLCPKYSWIISGTSAKDSGLSTWDDKFVAMFPGFGKAGFASLDGAILAQTIGTGADAQITLDTNAAGHGWFIDPTPTDNEEFLPTADPNVWMAKPGSATDGKMDMLSVLRKPAGSGPTFQHPAPHLSKHNI